jgi:hypothetical protein
MFSRSDFGPLHIIWQEVLLLREFLLRKNNIMSARYAQKAMVAKHPFQPASRDDIFSQRWRLQWHSLQCGYSTQDFEPKRSGVVEESMELIYQCRSCMYRRSWCDQLMLGCLYDKEYAHCFFIQQDLESD